ncbi:MAG: prepilin-type N-terminal cleavage/methylation domain-containing protein [Deltaproteobacteria bacterium]|nr:prepilin-type N-terminal cleavage/methylation domain-containing protein [Deltaproteobacteria bacterium]
MKLFRSNSGFTLVEMTAVILIIAVLAVIYFLEIDSYRDRRMSEMAAKTLMLAAKAQEDFFAREHRYFDAKISGNGLNSILTTPDGIKTQVVAPAGVALNIRTKGFEKKAFTGSAYYKGSKMVHKYDSETGKMTVIPRSQEDME